MFLDLICKNILNQHRIAMTMLCNDGGACSLLDVSMPIDHSLGVGVPPPAKGALV